METFAYVLLAVIGCAFALRFLVEVIQRFTIFKRELDTINMEISRTEGEEQRYWRHEKKELWLSAIPFYSRWRRSRQYK